MQKLTLFAMTEKGYSVVKALLASHPGLIDAVVSARDKAIAKDYFREIAHVCKQHHIPFYNRSDSYTIQTEYVLAISWRWLIEAGAARVIVFHDSLLPRYRGFNPLVTALINGDTEIGVTALYATTEYDRGEIIAQSASTISYPIRIQEAIETILTNYQALAVQVADYLCCDKEPPATPQNEAEATYSLWRDEEDYFIHWSESAQTIKRAVDAVGYPYRGAATYLEGKVARILQAEPLEEVAIANRVPGKVIFVQDAKPVVVCGHGLLRIEELVEDATGTSLLPLSHFRVRFKGLDG